MKEFYTDIHLNGGAKVKGIPVATANGEAVPFEQLNAAIEGIAWKDSARVASQVNVNLASPGAAIDGITLVSSDRVLIKAQTAPAENGVYIWNGAATPMTRATDGSTAPELEQATLSVEEGTSAGATYRQTAVNFTLESGAVSWTVFGSSTPSASETTAGVAEIATQAETDTGTDDLRMVTPLKLATLASRKKKASGTLGDGSATQIDVTHNFGTRDVIVEVYRNSGNYDTVLCDVSRPDANNVRFNFITAPTAAQFAYTLIA